MSKVIISLEDRGYKYIYHWFLLMISGLRKIQQYPDGDGVVSFNIREQNNKDFNINNYNSIYHVCLPDMENYLDKFHLETLDLIKDRFKFIRTEEISSSDIVLYNWGEVLKYHGSSNNLDKESYFFIKNLFSENIKESHNGYEYIYLRRNNSHLLSGNSGLKRRQIINESELENELLKYGFKSINLEEYSIIDKIKIFKNNKVVISPNSAGLIFSIFSENSTMVEINVENPSQISNQYKELCENMNLFYNKFTAYKIDNDDNMLINIEDFIKFMKFKNIIK